MSTAPRGRARCRRALVLWACGAWVATGPVKGHAAAPNPPPPPSTAIAASDIAQGEPEQQIPPGREGAWMAQKRYRMGKYKEAAEIYLKAVEGASSQSQLDFRYNAAAALHRAEQYQEAADLLTELMGLQASPDPSTAAALGASLYRASEAKDAAGADDLGEKARLLRASGEAFKEAARTGSEADVALRNLAVVLRTLPDLEEQAKIAALLERYKDKQPFAIADEMISAQREIDGRIPEALTNDSPAQVAQMEEIAQVQSVNADLWIPLKSKLLQAASQQGQSMDPQQAAAMESMIETTRDYMRDAAASLRDLDGRALDLSGVATEAVYGFWKGLAPYAPLLTEDLRRQTNAIAATTRELASPTGNLVAIADEQDAAVDLTELFVQRFVQAFPEESAASGPAQPEATGPSDQPATDPSASQPELSPEDRARILALAASALEAQRQAGSSITAGALDTGLRFEREAYEHLKDIEELLPRDPNNQQQQQDQPQDQQQEPEQQQQPPSEPQPEEDPEPSEEAPPPEPQPAEQEEQRKMTPEETERLLEKALQREQEHEAEKRERQRFVPLAPHERDW